MDIKELNNGINLNTHWYYQSKKIPLFKFFEKVRKLSDKNLDIVDIGSGSGFFSEELYKNYKDQINKIYLVDTAYESNDSDISKQQIVKQKEIPNKITNSVIILMDILEHIEDDARFLENIKEKIEGNNYFFITVPAFMSLWSGHDDFLGHYRRYKLNLLREILISNGFKIEDLYYIYGGIFPLVLAKRKFLKNTALKSDMAPMNPFINSFLKSLCGFEMNFRKINKLFGVTCVAEGIINS